MLGCGLAQSDAGLVQLAIISVSSNVQQPRSVQKQRFTALWPLSGSSILSVSSSETFPEISLSLQVCLCVCIIVLAHVYAEASVCAYIWSCMWRPEDDLRC